MSLYSSRLHSAVPLPTSAPPKKLPLLYLSASLCPRFRHQALCLRRQPLLAMGPRSRRILFAHTCPLCCRKQVDERLETMCRYVSVSRLATAMNPVHSHSTTYVRINARMFVSIHGFCSHKFCEFCKCLHTKSKIHKTAFTLNTMRVLANARSIICLCVYDARSTICLCVYAYIHPSLYRIKITVHIRKAYRRIQRIATPPPSDKIRARFEARIWDLIRSRIRRDASEGGMPVFAIVVLPVVGGICVCVCVCVCLCVSVLQQLLVRFMYMQINKKPWIPFGRKSSGPMRTNSTYSGFTCPPAQILANITHTRAQSCMRAQMHTCTDEDRERKR